MMKKTFLILAAVCFFLSFALSFFLVGYRFSGLLIAALGAYFIFMALTPSSFKKTRRTLSALVIIGVAFMATLCGFVLSEADGDVKAPCDYVVVLGARVVGETPSRTLSDRLRCAAEYLQENPSSIAIVSGSQGSDEIMTEALAMEKFLISRGIAKERIIKEEKARNTYENMLYSAEIINSHGGGSVAVISSDYHIFRARRLAENVGISPIMLSAKTELPILFLNCLLREAAALVKAYLVFM